MGGEAVTGMRGLPLDVHHVRRATGAGSLTARLALLAIRAALHGQRVMVVMHPAQEPSSSRWWVARMRAGPPACAATNCTAASITSRGAGVGGRARGRRTELTAGHTTGWRSPRTARR